MSGIYSTENEDDPYTSNQHRFRASYSSVRSRIERREWRIEKSHYPIYSDQKGHDYKSYKFMDHVHDDDARGDMARIYYQRARLSYTVRNGPAEDAKLREAQERRSATKPAQTSSSSTYKSKYSTPARVSSRDDSESVTARYVPFSTTLNATKRLDELHQEKKYRYTERAGAASASARVAPSSYSSSSDYTSRSSSSSTYIPRSSSSSHYTPSSRSGSRVDLSSASAPPESSTSN